MWAGATVYAQWSDLRRAPSRSKFQMLPEQRVWRALELKEEATTLFTAALQDERAQVEWADAEKALREKTAGGAPAATPSPSPGKAAEAKAGPGKVKAVAKAAAAKPKTKPAPLNSALVFLKPGTAEHPAACALAREVRTPRSPLPFLPFLS